MKGDISRRTFGRLVGMSAALATMRRVDALAAESEAHAAEVKPILGSWISVLWSDRRHYYWNDACAKFSREQWEQSVKEVADIGMQYLVLLATVEGGKAFFDTPLAPKAQELAYGEPIDALLSAADKYGVKFFVSTGFYGGWLTETSLTNPEIARGRFQLMEQVTARFGHHKSFYGWYLPDEPGINPYYTDEFIKSVNMYGREGRRLMPHSKILIAPYGTHLAVSDDAYVKQLEQLDVDIIAYQDEVGCERMAPEASARAYEKLRAAHNRAPQRALWADVEVFAWEGPANLPSSPLIPAPFARIKKQLSAVSPFVDVVTIYQYQGLFSKPDSPVPSDHPGATTLYTDYVNWLTSAHPDMVTH